MTSRRAMRKIALPLLIALSMPTAAEAATQADFAAAYKSAAAAEQRAGALRNRWTTTEEALKAATKAAAAQEWDEATALAKRAEALAAASIAQAGRQQTLWRDAVIR